ncbi:MAG: glycine--tRNA ligase [Candidatus Campbellbacteria bacterium]|nr:glycine--tRNA ligase [Candidatus Campbellbacteria bacterium]
MSENKKEEMDTLVALLKRRGFIYPTALIYDGVAGFFDYGPYGAAMKENIKRVWWEQFVSSRENIYGIDGAIVLPRVMLEASGHVGGFSDPITEDTETGERFRADHLLEEAGVDTEGMSTEDMTEAIEEGEIKSPAGNPLSEARDFNLMLKTQLGSDSGPRGEAYLRPETAQSIFVNFKNILDSFSPKLPFGIAQIGKAFRNEISPRNFVFRIRELEQMEVEYFVREEEWSEHFSEWQNIMNEFASRVGIDPDKLHEVEVSEADRAHYSKRTIDFEFEYPFGQKELWGLAYRTDYDLSRHIEHSGAKLEYFDQESGERFVPHVIEPSLGIERTMLAIFLSAYSTDETGEESRVFLKLPYEIAPVKVAVFPLLKNKPQLTSKAREIFSEIKKEIPATHFDDNGNIGKRYRRQDEIGTPFCITVDFDTLEDDSVTVRHRDTGEQERVAVSDIIAKIKNS